MRREIVSTKQDRQWQGIPGIERAVNGRLWCTFFSGGPREPDSDNYILLTTSADDGKTWSPPEAIVTAPGRTRAYDPALWHDPNGRLWLLYNLADPEAKDYSVWAVTADDSTRAALAWSRPQRVSLQAPFAFRLNKPTVIATGDWLLPVTWAKTTPVGDPLTRPFYNGWFAAGRLLQGVAVSTDSGATWTLHGAVKAPEKALENMIIEHRDGQLRMLIRTGSGVLWESVSSDHGRTWAAGSPTDIVNPGARFFIRRLGSGRLLLINTPNLNGRTGLRAYVSDLQDDMMFGAGLQLDAREKVSYPDAVQAPDGMIYAVHDCFRRGLGEIILDVFDEDEILAEQSASAGADTRRT